MKPLMLAHVLTLMAGILLGSNLAGDKLGWLGDNLNRCLIALALILIGRVVVFKYAGV